MPPVHITNQTPATVMLMSEDASYDVHLLHLKANTMPHQVAINTRPPPSPPKSASA